MQWRGFCHMSFDCQPYVQSILKSPLRFPMQQILPFFASIPCQGLFREMILHHTPKAKKTP